MIWMARWHNSSKALILFGDRVTDQDLHVVETPIPLRVGAGRTMVDSAANRADIFIL